MDLKVVHKKSNAGTIIVSKTECGNYEENVKGKSCIYDQSPLSVSMVMWHERFGHFH